MNLGITLSDTTVGNILREHGVEPAPKRQRKTTWRTFLKSHWEVLASVDFTTIEVWTTRGLMTFYILVAMQFEENDLKKAQPEYESYKQRVPMLIPAIGRLFSKPAVTEAG